MRAGVSLTRPVHGLPCFAATQHYKQSMSRPALPQFPNACSSPALLLLHMLLHRSFCQLGQLGPQIPMPALPRFAAAAQRAEEFLSKANSFPRFAGGAFDFISVCPPYMLVSYEELYDLLEKSPLLHEVRAAARCAVLSTLRHAALRCHPLHVAPFAPGLLLTEALVAESAEAQQGASLCCAAPYACR